MGILPNLSSQQRATNSDGTLTPPWYRYLKAVADLAVRALFEAIGIRARVGEVALAAQQAEDEAKIALLIALSRRDGEFSERIGFLAGALSLLQQQQSAATQQARMRELDVAREERAALDRTLAQILQNSNKAWFFEQQLEELSGELENQTTTTIAEGTNLYFTDERVDDRVALLVQNGTGLAWTYNDGSGTLTGNVSLAAFSTTNLSEGTNQYFTNARARSALSGADCIDYNSSTGAIGITPRTGYSAITGTAARGAIATYTAPVISASPTQAEVQAIADALQAVSRRQKAHDDDLTTSGILGT